MPNTESTQRAEEARWAKIFKALGHPLRYRLYLEAFAKPLTVTELVAISGRSQPAVSQYLNALRRAGLVRVTRRGRNMIYEGQAVDWTALSRRPGAQGGPKPYEAGLPAGSDGDIFPEFTPAPAAGARDTEDFIV